MKKQEMTDEEFMARLEQNAKDCTKQKNCKCKNCMASMQALKELTKMGL